MARTTAAPPTPPRRRRVVLPLAAVAGALALAFGIGRWTAPEPERAPAVAHAPVAPPVPTQWEVVAPAPLPAQAVAEAAPAAASVPAAPAKPVKLTPEIANRVNQEATAKLEGLREQVVATCLPPSGGSAKKRASITYNITFDAQGREIARGITEDRRAPPGAEFTKCLRGLNRSPLTVSPPGTNVALSIPVSYP